jgi:arsenate reductase
MGFIIYHNPRCSKSRKTLDILHAKGVDPAIVPYLEAPPDGATILDIAGRLGVSVAALLRRGEDEVKQGRNLPDLDDDSGLADWIAAHPKALQRPIVVDTDSGRVIVGRPPENVEELFT